MDNGHVNSRQTQIARAGELHIDILDPMENRIPLGVCCVLSMGQVGRGALTHGVKSAEVEDAVNNPGPQGCQRSCQLGLRPITPVCSQLTPSCDGLPKNPTSWSRLAREGADHTLAAETNLSLPDPMVMFPFSTSK